MFCAIIAQSAGPVNWLLCNLGSFWSCGSRKTCPGVLLSHWSPAQPAQCSQGNHLHPSAHLPTADLLRQSSKKGFIPRAACCVLLMLELWILEQHSPHHPATLLTQNATLWAILLLQFISKPNQVLSSSLVCSAL